MSNNIDKKKMRQNAMDIKSQRKERIEKSKQQEEIEEDNKVTLYYINQFLNQQIFIVNVRLNSVAVHSLYVFVYIKQKKRIKQSYLTHYHE